MHNFFSLKTRSHILKLHGRGPKAATAHCCVGLPQLPGLSPGQPRHTFATHCARLTDTSRGSVKDWCQVFKISQCMISFHLETRSHILKLHGRGPKAATAHCCVGIPQLPDCCHSTSWPLPQYCHWLALSRCCLFSVLVVLSGQPLWVPVWGKHALESHLDSIISEI